MATPDDQARPVCDVTPRGPLLPSIRREDVEVARRALQDELRQLDLTKYRDTIRLYGMAYYFLGMLDVDDAEDALSRIRHAAEMLGVDLPSGTAGGEAPR